MELKSFFVPGSSVIVLGFDEPPEAVCETLLVGDLKPSYAFRGIIRKNPLEIDAMLMGYGHNELALRGTPVQPMSVMLANAIKGNGLVLRSQDDSGEPGPLTYVVVRVDRDRIDRAFDLNTFVRSLAAIVVTTLREAIKPAN